MDITANQKAYPQPTTQKEGCGLPTMGVVSLLKTEIKSTDIAAMISTVVSSVFGATTGAQIPIDGGNDRVI